MRIRLVEWRFVSASVLVLIIPFYCSLLASEEKEFSETTAEIVVVNGSGTYSDPQRADVNLIPGLRVGAKGKIAIGKDSEVRLRLGSGDAEFLLTSATELVIERMRFRQTESGTVYDIYLRLNSGSIVWVTQKLSASESKYEFITPVSLVSVGDNLNNALEITASGAMHVIKGKAIVVFSHTRSIGVAAGYSAFPPINLQKTDSENMKRLGSLIKALSEMSTPAELPKSTL